MRRLRYLTSARNDLDAIYRYLRREGASAETARGFLAKLRRKCARIAALPGRMGRPRPELRPDLLSTAFQSYVIFFRHAGDIVEIVNILEGHRDIDGHFDGNE